MKHYDAVIIGAGLSGLCAAIDLKKAGLNNIKLYEKADDVGGTWRDNHYPGVACDVPSHLYSYSFEPNPNWSKWYGTGEEILDYIRHCARKYEIIDHISFNTKVTKAVWEGDHWKVITSSGEVVTSRFLIAGMGGLHTPNTPNFSGMKKFGGPMFHTADWQHDVDLKGKRVAVVGTGATAVQCIPEIAKEAESLYVFQRSPVWVGPKNDPFYSEEEKADFNNDPVALKKHRWDLWKSWETTGLDMVKAGSAINMTAERRARDLIKRSLVNPELAKKLTPDYNFTCKRPTFSNNYYSTFELDNVHLVTSGVDNVTETGLTSAGQNFDVDVIIFATGFKPFNIALEIDLIGLKGMSLDETWKTHINSYQSIMVRDLPNFFMMLGPNSGGLTSTLQMIEQQSKYILKAINKMDSENINYINPKQKLIDQFTNRIQIATAKTTHNKGCTSWWSDGQGYNHSVWPESSITYRMMMRDFNIDHFDCAPFVENMSVGGEK
ncbi:MAG: 4-hydroxyacetophenone monooxygenase [Alphaproteobacteria bacterium]|nr:MAG: 4-hydroxyacetophenone monooxygenase [Alphaproteobacteria bacterium]